MDAIASRPFHFEFIAPPADLAGQVNTFFVLETNSACIEEFMPAYSAQMFVFARGSATMHFESGDAQPSGKAFINAPLLRAAPYTLHGPARCIGASLTPLGWSALSGMPVNEVHDCLFDAEQVLSGVMADHMQSLSRHEDAEKICEGLADILRGSTSPPKPEHVAMVEATTQWLASAFSPPLEDLYRRIPLSERQVQRLCKRFYGVPPAQLLKRFRAVRAAALLAQDDLPEAARDEVMLAYFDQAHLIRDIRRYTGRTPTGFIEDSLATNTLDPSGHGPAAAILREALGQA